MQFVDLAEVHSRGHTQRVEDDIDRGSIRHERHIFHRENLGDNTLISVTAGHLVTHGDLAALSHVHAHGFVDVVGKLVVVLGGELADANHNTGLAVRHAQRGIANFLGLLSKDGA